MGLHTGEPHLDDAGYVGVGVHRAARICDAAHGGQVLVSIATAGIVEDAEVPGVELRDVGEHRLKGLPREQRLFELTAHGLRSRFDRPRTPKAAAQTPGVGTFLLTDLSGWRQVLRVLGDEASAGLVADYQTAVTTAVEANNGVVLERVGDSVTAVCRGASDALRAVLVLRDALADFTFPSECDVSLSVVVHSGRWSGDPRQPAAGTAFVRLHEFGRIVKPGQVLVSQTTAALLEGDRSAPDLRYIGERRIPDVTEPVRFYELAEPP
jgi:class 3 adenylate cyclase